jgi:hypothetical protein
MILPVLRLLFRFVAWVCMFIAAVMIAFSVAVGISGMVSGWIMAVLITVPFVFCFRCLWRTR